MAVDMTPQSGDSSVQLPVTFDYNSGRSGNLKGKIIMTLIIVGLTVIGVAGVSLNENFELWCKILIVGGILYAALFLIRFLVLKESYFSDIFENLLLVDYKMQILDVWQIFDIEQTYPYICYFRNGYKGIFVQMEKDAITGKPEDFVYTHYEAVGDAYNVCHALNMNMIHLDYMDNVGNDLRMNNLYDNIQFMENPDMQDMMVDIYDNLVEEMSRNYASFDVYLFLTRDNVKNFMYNVQQVSSIMMGGNFITYKVLDMYGIARLCTSLLNFHEFSVLDAFDAAMSGASTKAIIPISVTHADGSVDIINKTTAERRKEQQERERKAQEMKTARKRRKNSTGVVLPDDNLDLFDSSNMTVKKAESKNPSAKQVSNDLKLFKDGKDSESDEDLNLFG